MRNLSGTNTGDQDLFGLATNEALEDVFDNIRRDLPDTTNLANISALNDTASAIRNDIPDVSGLVREENDPVFQNSAASKISDSELKKLRNLTGKNTGDQNLAEVIATGINANGQIKNLSDPTDDKDAATKAYVDALKEMIYNELLAITHGAFYTWNAATNGEDLSAEGTEQVQGVCPAGCHLPDYDEWIELVTYLRLNGYNYDGTDQGNKYAKALASPAGWKETNKSGAPGSNAHLEYANLSGFSAFPAGSRNING